MLSTSDVSAKSEDVKVCVSAVAEGWNFRGADSAEGTMVQLILGLENEKMAAS